MYQDSYSLQMGLLLSYQVHFQQLETIEKILPSSVITQEALNKESVYLVFIIFLPVGSSTSYTYPVTLFYESFLTSLLPSFFFWKIWNYTKRIEMNSHVTIIQLQQLPNSIILLSVATDQFVSWVFSLYLKQIPEIMLLMKSSSVCISNGNGHFFP